MCPVSVGSWIHGGEVGETDLETLRRKLYFYREPGTRPYANFGGRGRFPPPPEVWSNPPRSSQHHAWEAQRNINACASCHVERDCATCHATPARGGRGFGPKTGPAGLGDSGFGGQGVNPHPRSFRDRCAGALRRNARPCLVCHDPADSKLQECR